MKIRIKNHFGHRPLRVGSTAIVTVFTTQNPILLALARMNQWIETTAQYFF